MLDYLEKIEQRASLTPKSMWFNDVILSLGEMQSDKDVCGELLKQFEFFDEKQEGYLDIANFKTVLIKSGLGLTVHQIELLVQYIPKSRENMVDYHDFLESINRGGYKTENVNKLQTCTDLKDFLYHLAPKFEKLTRKLQKQDLTAGKVKLNSFLEFL